MAALRSLDDERELAAVVSKRALDVFTVPCPVCGAGTGQPCDRPLKRSAERHQSHAARWIAYQGTR